ncbi:MAG TPA: hypothetical protein VK906_04570 [Egicoccus sp.]|nr:hypothetical protein [Egicoccus sp.]HSK22423.1 hypothetical protein [Egicoccus sp.]
MRVHLRDDGLLHLPAEAVKASAIAFLRIFLGFMWLFEVTVGHNWKIGGPGSGTNPAWMGPGAGDAVRDAAASAVADGTYGWAAWVFDTIVAPNAATIGYLVIGLQIALAVAFIVGVAVRPMAVLGLGLNAWILLLGDDRVTPYFVAMHVFMLVAGGGAYYGLDGWILERTRWTERRVVRGIRRVLAVPPFDRGRLAPGVAVFALLAVGFVLTVPNRATDRFAYVALELALLSGLAALGFYATSRYGDRLAAVTATLRIFVGLMLLYEIFAWTTSGVDALPGFAPAAAQAGMVEAIAANHWSLFRLIANLLVLPEVAFWSVLLGSIQLIVGAALLLGYRTRLAGLVGLGYLGILVAFGFTRLAPLVFGLLVAVVALDGGRILSLDSVRRPGLGERFGLPIPMAAVPFLIVLAAINALAAGFTAFQAGITPDGYVTSMPAVVTAFVAILSGLLAFAGWLQRHPELDHSGEMLSIGQRTEAEPF